MNPPPATPPPLESKLAVVMVGLPGRGKSYTARKLARYLYWLGYRAHVFNLGAYRRDQVGAAQPHTFFDPANPEGEATRDRLARVALDDMIAWCAEGGQVGLYDATNSTEARRAYVLERCEQAGMRVVFVELDCDEPAIIEANIRETKVSSPDYEGVDPETAATDFRARIEAYRSTYVPLRSDRLSYIRVVDAGRQVVANRVHGYLEGRILNFLVNLHIGPRKVWLTRHGESEDNVLGRLGGDASLSDRGRVYAAALREFLDRQDPGPAHVWASTLRRSVETAEATGRSFLPIKFLDEIDAGECDGMTYDEIAERMPAVAGGRASDKLRYRYPRGESYEDVIRRLDPLLTEIERHRAPLLVIGHQAVLRCLYAYLQGSTERERIPFLEIPLHTVIELVPTAYGCEERRLPLEPGPG